MKNRLLRILVILSVLAGSITLVQSPAFALCQTVAFNFRDNGASWTCSGDFSVSGRSRGYVSRGWGGFFHYRFVEPVYDPLLRTRYFCDWEDVTFPLTLDPFTYQYVQIWMEPESIYLAATRPSWC